MLQSTAVRPFSDELVGCLVDFVVGCEKERQKDLEVTAIRQGSAVGGSTFPRQARQPHQLSPIPHTDQTRPQTTNHHRPEYHQFSQHFPHQLRYLLLGTPESLPNPTALCADSAPGTPDMAVRRNLHLTLPPLRFRSSEDILGQHII